MNHVLHGVHIGATWRIRWIDLCSSGDAVSRTTTIPTWFLLSYCYRQTDTRVLTCLWSNDVGCCCWLRQSTAHRAWLLADLNTVNPYRDRARGRRGRPTDRAVRASSEFCNSWRDRPAARRASVQAGPASRQTGAHDAAAAAAAAGGVSRSLRSIPIHRASCVTVHSGGGGRG